MTYSIQYSRIEYRSLKLLPINRIVSYIIAMVIQSRVCFRVLCTAILYALYLQEVSEAFLLLQSPPLSRSGSSSSTPKYKALVKEQEYDYDCAAHQNDPQLYKTYPLTKPESECWALRQNLDGKHALTHSLFREVATHLRSSTAPNGSRATLLPFIMKRDADKNNVDGDDLSNIPIVEFTCDDLESALASDYLDACTGMSSRNTSNDGSTSTVDDDVQQGGWRMEELGSPSTGTTSTSSNSNLNSNPQNHSFQSKRLHWTSVLDAKNTVVFNSAGAHISSQLAPTSLAALHGLDGAATGVCLNLYVTKSDI
jgi:hypothetical protein